MSGKLRIGLVIMLALAASIADAKENSGKKRTRRTRTETVEKTANEKTANGTGSARKTTAGETGGNDGAAETEITVAAANRAVGGNFFSEQRPLWECSSSEVAKRMKMTLPKGGENNPVHSVFTKRKVSFCGCGAEEFRFFIREGKIIRVDVMILDKGDSVKGKVVSSKRSDFSKRLQREERELCRNLDSAFGASVNGVFGSGNQARRLPHWFCREAAIAVEMVDREFLMLHILPREEIGRRKSPQSANRLDRAKLDLTGNIRREKNGDVFIDGVPMVDQGSKGYCVPATLERCFRYYGITDFDMHRIADAGHTSAGGGTALTSALAGLGPMLHDCRLRRVSYGKLRLRGIIRGVDAGTPLIWALYSSPDYLKRLKEHNAAREKNGTSAQWKVMLRKMRRLPPSKQGAHVCLIIGYNSATEEIAVSNSWGAGGELAWVRFVDAAAADAGEELYVLQPR